MSDLDALRAANRLIAAAVAHREALRSGQGPSWQPEFLTAVDAYLAARTDLDRARDDHLIRHPTADGLSRAARHHLACICTIEQAPGKFPRIVDREPDCPVHGTGQHPRAETWKWPGGTVACPLHIDGCPVP